MLKVLTSLWDDSHEEKSNNNDKITNINRTSYRSLRYQRSLTHDVVRVTVLQSCYATTDTDSRDGISDMWYHSDLQPWIVLGQIQN